MSRGARAHTHRNRFLQRVHERIHGLLLLFDLPLEITALRGWKSAGGQGRLSDATRDGAERCRAGARPSAAALAGSTHRGAIILRTALEGDHTLQEIAVRRRVYTRTVGRVAVSLEARGRRRGGRQRLRSWRAWNASTPLLPARPHTHTPPRCLARTAAPPSQPTRASQGAARERNSRRAATHPPAATWSVGTPPASTRPTWSALGGRRLTARAQRGARWGGSPVLAHSWGSLCCCGFSAALVHSGAPPAFSLHSCDVSSGMCLERLESLTPSKNRMEKKGTPRVARRLLASQLLGGAGSSSNDSMRQLIALARACGLMRHLPMAKPRRMPMDGERIREAMGGPARVRPGVPMTHTMASEARGSGTAVAASKRHLTVTARSASDLACSRR